MVQTGGVPSGSFNTSHMDSWIMGLYIFLFGVWQIVNSSDEEREAVEEVVLDLLLVVYGDDHLYNKGSGIGQSKLSGKLFAAFMKQYFDVDVRDIFDGISLLSLVMDGEMVERGACFLKHFLVDNPFRDVAGQPPVLPWRATFDFVIRAVWGREAKYRDLGDILLSVIGHAYGTYASNADAYEVLLTMYLAIINRLGAKHGQVLADVVGKLGNEDLRKLRQLNLSVSDVLAGFPSMEELMRRNEWDENYHDFRQVVYDHDPGFLFDL